MRASSKILREAGAVLLGEIDEGELAGR